RRPGGSHAALLAGAAAVVRDRRAVLDSGDAEAGGDHARDGVLAPGAGAGDADLDLGHAHLADLLAALLAGAGGGERRGLAGALEADGARRVPGEGLAVGVGDGDQRVVVRRLDVGDAADDVLADLLDLLGHGSLLSLPLGGSRRAGLGAGECGCCRAGARGGSALHALLAGDGLLA